MAPHHLAGVQPRPKIAGAVFKQTDEPVSGKARSVALVEDGEAHSVKAHQPVKGRKPQITVLRLQNFAHGVLWQAVVRRPVIEAVLRRRRSSRA